MTTVSSGTIELASIRNVPSESEDFVAAISWTPSPRLRETELRSRVQSLAYLLWKERGSPPGSPDQDWFEAERTLGVADADAPPLLSPFGIEHSTR